jgi:acyl-CoA dehydrogenase
MSADLQSIILETARRIFSDYVTPETLMGAAHGVFPEELWSRLEQNGFTVVDEDGLTYADGLALLQVAGYYAVPVPLAESILASKIISDLKFELPKGVLTVGLVPDGPVTVEETPDGILINGQWRDVPWARRADVIVLWIPYTNGRGCVVLVNKEDIIIDAHTNLASEPMDRVFLENVVLNDYVFVEESHRDLLAHGALTRIMQAGGVLERMLDMTVQYAGERSQFGRAIAKYQAVQQQIAEMACETAAFRAIANKARKTIESAEDESNSHVVQFVEAGTGEALQQKWNGNDVVKYAALAKIRFAQAAQVCTTHAHQIHGAMGITEEYILHHFTRRVWSYRHEVGNERVWSNVLARAMEGELWEFITS